MFSSPDEWWTTLDAPYVQIDDVIDQVILLCYERHGITGLILRQMITEQYGLTMDRYNKLKDKAIVMPCTVNRGVKSIVN